MKIKKLAALLLAATMVVGTPLSMAETVTPSGNAYGFAGTNGMYYTDYQTLAEEQQAAKELAIEIGSEGFVLLKNENNALPLKKGSYVSLFGMHSVNLIPSTNGSAGGSTGANGIEESTLQMAMENAGYKVNAKLLSLYTKQNALGTVENELPISAYSNATISTYNGYHDAAIIVLSRIGSESADKQTDHVAGHSDPTDHELMLDDHEKALVKHVKAYYTDTPIIVLINSSNILQVPELAEPKATSEYGVDAIFWVGNTGNNAIEAIGQLISGEVNPSGHTVEVWEKDFAKGPSFTNFAKQTQNKDENGNPMDAYYYYNGEATKYATVEYREGIYVGYKYYETRYDDAAEGDKDAAYANVLYPFGYGLSYTSFDWELVPSEENTITDAFEKMSMQVKVTNAGSVAGKDVVQVYVNPPYTKGGIEKASANLVGFAKTELLQPGESQVVTIEWVAQDMASFDWNDQNANDFVGYELEAGTYELTARRNSHDVVLGENYTVDAGIRCTTDYTSGAEITALFVDDFTSVNDSLLAGRISRENGLAQPAAATVADRTLTDEQMEILDGQYTYHSYMDQGYEDWYVEEDGIPAGWTQSAAHAEGTTGALSILDMTGVDFSLDIADGAVVQGDDEGSKKWEAFMNQLTWEEMCGLIRNGGGVETAIDYVGVNKAGAYETPLQMSGGTMWACPPILAATFNVKLAQKEGVMMGNEALFKGVSYWQGNAMNIHRSPLSGRNVEYYSQDGVHGGIFAAAVAAGVTSKGVTCQIKHMMLNDQESFRDLNGGVAVWADEQTIRELYAKPFEYALKSGNSTGVMGSFNRIGNINSQLNGAVKDLVRDEWDNRAIFETDAWQGTYCPIDLMVRQGNNQILGSGSSLPVVDLEVGTWDESANCVLVSDGGDSVFASQTHYAAVRKSAQEILWNYSNSNAIQNGFVTIDETMLEYDRYVAAPQSIEFTGIDFLNMELAEGSELPTGFTLENGILTYDGTVDSGEWTVDVTLHGIDGYISKTASVIIRIVDPIHVSETALKVGQAANVMIDAPSYAYNGMAEMGNAYVSTMTDTEGNPVVGQTFTRWSGEEKAVGTGDSVMGSWRILNWYWQDASYLPSGGSYEVMGAIAFADIEATDARYLETADVLAGNYYKAVLYGYSISDEDAAKLAEYGLAVDKVMSSHLGYQEISYDVNTALVVTGTPVKAGTVEFTVTLELPLVKGFGSRWPNYNGLASPTVTEIARTVSLSIGE